jgi:hypothetical protein
MCCTVRVLRREEKTGKGHKPQATTTKKKQKREKPGLARRIEPLTSIAGKSANAPNNSWKDDILRMDWRKITFEAREV